MAWQARGLGNGTSPPPPRTSVVSGATRETVRSESGLANKTRQGRTFATIPKSTSKMSPFFGKFVIQNLRGWLKTVPNLLQDLVCVRNWRKAGQTRCSKPGPSKRGVLLIRRPPQRKWWPARVTRPVLRIKSPLHHHFNARRPGIGSPNRSLEERKLVLRIAKLA